MRNLCSVLTALLLPLLLDAKCDLNSQKLIEAYPSQLKSCSDNKIIWRDGISMLYDDGAKKSFNQRLTHPDIQDMFIDSYLQGRYSNPSHNYDPGRYRNDKFFRKMYGNSNAGVKKNLTVVDWFGQRVNVTRVNGVNRQLAAVAKELEQYPSLKGYLKPIGGTFKWRKIAGTNRLSVHSFGAAIDINVKYSAYWRWSKSGYRYQNKIPLQIVKVFEKYGFIWGGKWYHYDTMHFEYRPELLR